MKAMILRCIMVVAILALAGTAAASPLKIMPLGDSVTAGFGSTDNAGYLKCLGRLLGQASVPFDFVGTQQGGYTADPQHEGHGGYASIDLLAGRFSGEGVASWLTSNPADVVLLMVGYNDIFNNTTLTDTQLATQFAANLNAILNAIRGQTAPGGAPIKVLLAKIGTITNGQQAVVDRLNATIQSVFEQRKDQGGLWLVDMSVVLASQADLVDIVHPNDSGYAKMASAWMFGLRAAGIVPSLPTLRVMPVGDSLTSGAFSSDYSGYERRLHGLLTDNGTTIDFVGSKTNGFTQDPQNEGYGRYTSGDVLHGTPGDAGGSGLEIKEPGPGIASRLTQYAPDAVLLLIGLNDVFDHISLATTSQNLNGIADAIATYGSNRGKPVTLLLAKLTAVNNGQQPQVDAINGVIQSIYDQRAAQGNITLVDMSALLSPQDFSQSEPVAHPNDDGYAKMACAWFAGFQSAGLTAATLATTATGADVQVPADNAVSAGTGASSSSGGGGGGCTTTSTAGFDPILSVLMAMLFAARWARRQAG